ncbi:hypothetical protein CS0771_36600 [Catellatospora sp. IY07-71]|uniref:peptidylprolyl isomerase n=1 Tax=Catellatospora sp. IY07-71 TaxID=2728827 RepID=UPI001BB3C9E3|nr:peptidylprolyl isomerase [Catellatospora sp. IY07-71]BCJ74116.1 hypothetical protein CS0771_36600 [Catellatospora sp. IY07-71]
MTTPPWTPEPAPQSSPAPQAKGTSGWLIAAVLAAIAAVLVCVLLAVVFLVIRAGSGVEEPAGAPPAGRPSVGAAQPQAGTAQCRWLPDSDGNPHVKDVGRPPSEVPATGTPRATLRLGQGTVTFELYADKAPCAVASLTYLAGKGYFDGTKCHRLVTEGIKVLQCGDPSGTGMGGPAYRFAEENLPTHTAPPYPAGTLAMAKTQAPETTGSQFFIVWGDTPIDPAYTVLGKVTAGLDVVQAIGAAGAVDQAGAAAGDGTPKTPVVVSGLTVTP